MIFVSCLWPMRLEYRVVLFYVTHRLNFCLFPLYTNKPFLYQFLSQMPSLVEFNNLSGYFTNTL